MEIIGDDPTLILLDELPPYLLNANARAVGNGTLADLVTFTLSSLLSAAIKLPRCCVVIANLSGSYDAQTKDLTRVMSNLQQESRRQAAAITPVQLAGNEIYEILKKRLFTQMPGDDVIDSVAEAYAEQVKAAEDGDYIIARAMEQVAEEVRETYPFHPSFKNLVALFKENEGFRQTRGLMQFTARLLRSVWNRRDNDVFLIGPQHLDLNDATVRDEIQRINPSLLPAVVNDIADHGNARAEEVDADLSSDAASQVAKLLLSASLSRSVGAHVGLTEAEVTEYLAAPFRKPDEFHAVLDGRNPKDGTAYIGPFEVPASGCTALVAAKAGDVEKTATFTVPAAGDDRVVIDRVPLDRPRWTAIRAEVQRAFNARLKQHKLATAHWKLGDVPVDRLLGKELCVLAWAIEELGRDHIALAVRNWLALRPEECWWLFGMTAMATGGVHDSGHGWRVALRHALGDVAQSEVAKARAIPRLELSGQLSGDSVVNPGLFD
jgi:hypothetical protein